MNSQALLSWLRPRRLPLFLLLLISFRVETAGACTGFSLGSAERSVMAKNLDWQTGNGMVVVNKRNVQRTAVVHNTKYTDNPALWTSRYGSVTFNQVGRDFPYGGMNEKGLSIEILWLNETEYPAVVPGRNTLNESQWIQYMLDQASSLSDIQELQENIQIRSGFAKVHYFTCEASGDCAVFEFLDGELVVHRLKSKDLKLITNDTYQESTTALKKFTGFGGEKSIPQDATSLSRFVRAAALLKSSLTDSEPLVNRAFSVLDKVRSPDTQWSIVYDATNKKIFYKLAKTEVVKEISLSFFNFSCGLPVKNLRLQNSFKGEVSSHFEDYSDAFNHAIVESNHFLPAPFWKIIEDAPKQDLCGG